MKLIKYRVTGFRSIEDSGWIDASDVTALIGENEAGKTNLLLPLWKLNPSGDGAINLLDDMPRSRYAEMRNAPSDHDFIQAVFELSETDKARCQEYGVEVSKANEIEVVRNYKGGYGITLVEAPGVDLTKQYKPEPEPSAGEEDADASQNAKPSLHGILRYRLPKFVYYSNYGNLDAQIYLPHVVENLSRDDLGSKEAAKARTLKVLFDLVSLSAQEILELGEASSTDDPVTSEEIEENEEQLRERSALLQSASTKLTRSFRDWWKQGDYRFRLDVDGSYFRIWVSDDRRSEEIELENRSTGLQWFLSFFLVFTYESEDAHDNSIILLDEPGHSLHPLAQKDLSQFFDSLSKDNQIIFTTHSPFMIDSDRLDRVRKVYVDEQGFTVASGDLGRPSKAKDVAASKGATYAVHSALNLTVAESFLLGCSPVIVEGPSDQHYLTAIKNVLISKGEISPPSELIFPPAGGARTANIIASILMGRDDKLPIVLLDGDTAGKQAAGALKSNLYSGSELRLLSTDDFTSMNESEIEDLMPSSLMIQVLDRQERRAEVDFEDTYEAGKPLVPQVKSWAKTNGFELEKDWKVKLSIGVKEKLLNNPDRHLVEGTVQKWKKLFESFYSL